MSEMQNLGAGILAAIVIVSLVCGFMWVCVSAIDGQRWARWVMAALLGCVVVFALLAVSGVLG